MHQQQTSQQSNADQLYYGSAVTLIGQAAVDSRVTLALRTMGRGVASNQMGRPVVQFRQGFTLIELLIAISIIALLAGMLMPVIGVAQKNADKQNTLNGMRKIEQATNAFKSDIRAFPWSTSPSTSTGPWTNDLGYRLARKLTQSELTTLRSDLGQIKPSVIAQFPASSIDQPKQTYNPNAGPGESWSSSDQTQLLASICVQRIASERAKVAIMAGNTGIRKNISSGGTSPWTEGSTPMITAQGRGWGDDYLSGQYIRHDMDTGLDGTPETILDRFGSPLIFINPVVNGVDGFIPQDMYGAISPRWFGLEAKGRTPTTSIASDARTTAASSFIYSFEIWSAGPDGAFDSNRNNTSKNRDNIALANYHKDLQ